MKAAWQVNEADEERLSKSFVQSEEQQQDNIFSHEWVVWRVRDVDAGWDTEQTRGLRPGASATTYIE